MDFPHCFECAGYGFKRNVHKDFVGFETCSTCKGKQTRKGKEWDTSFRIREVLRYQGCMQLGYAWHFVCVSCSYRFFDGFKLADCKFFKYFPCCKNPQLVVHSPIAASCDCSKSDST